MWWIYSPKSKEWAKANEAMAKSLLSMMKIQPQLYEGWKVLHREEAKDGI